MKWAHKWKYKDPYYLPKNTFTPRPREYYASLTTYKVPEHLQKKLEEYLKKPQPKFNKQDYLIVCYRNSSDPKPQQDLANFAYSIAPDRRRDGINRVFLVKRPKGTTQFYALNPSTKDQLLPIIFEAIDKGIL